MTGETLNYQVNWLDAFIKHIKTSAFTDPIAVENLTAILRTLTQIEQGHAKGLDTDAIKQFVNHHVEKLQVLKQHLEDTTDLKTEINELEARLHRIFGGSDYS